VNLVFEEPRAGLSLVSDEGKINQILRNLISNALKFTERGEVCVRVSRENQHLSFSVIDSGIGIAAQDQEKIFREFAQIENPVQRKIRGTGLGLPLSRKLAELLGGSLTVTSELGHGSTFVLTLPLSVADAEEWKAADDGDKGLVAPPSSQEAERENILVIDDDEVARYLVHQIFRGTPYLITEASGGVEGLERARFDQPSLILLDLAMPDRNGFEVLADLKSDPATRDIPVILHTSTTLTESDVKRLNSWHAGILSKETHDREKILAMIREMLRGTSVSH
jgi:CheY-like chemotaxis protein